MTLHRTPFKRSVRFALLLVLLILGVTATATFMSLRSAERTMLVTVERTLSSQARDDIADLMVWYAGLRGQLDRVANSDVFKLYASESLRIGKRVASGLQTEVDSEAEALAARAPFMKKLLGDFVAYTEFESARLLNAGHHELLSAGDYLTPLSTEQHEAVKHVFDTGNFATSTVRNTPHGPVLDLFQPVYPPDYVENDIRTQAPVAVLVATRNITDRVTRVEHNAQSTPGGSARLVLRHEGGLQAIRPEGLRKEPIDWPLERGQLPMKLRTMPSNANMVYVSGLPVPGLPWLLIEGQTQEHAEATFRRQRQLITTVAVVSAVGVISLLSLIWWLVVGRRDKAFTSELSDLQATVNRQNQLLESLDAALPAGVMLCDEAGRLIHVSPHAAAMLNHTASALQGLALIPLLPASMAGPVQTAMEHVRTTDTPATCTVNASLPGWNAQDAHQFHVQCTPFHNLAGQPAGVLCVVHDRDA